LIFIPTGYFPVHSGEKKKVFGYSLLTTKKIGSNFSYQFKSFMQNLLSSHTFKTAIRLILVVTASFILVNLLA
jgi:hypothetical protein